MLRNIDFTFHEIIENNNKKLTQHLFCFLFLIEWVNVLCRGNTPDELFSGAYDGSIKVWSVERTEKLRTLSYHTKPISSIVCSNQMLAAASLDHYATLWDHSRIKKPVSTWSHEDGISCLAVGVNELYTGGRDGVIKVIDTRMQRIRGELRGHADWVSKLAVFNEGGKQWVLSSSHDGTVRQWNPERLACVNTFNVHRGAINDVTITSTGTVVTAGADIGCQELHAEGWSTHNLVAHLRRTQR